MITRLKCSMGHSWEPASTSSAPLVCPSCGRPPLPSSAGDLDQTVDQDLDRTVDLPTPAPSRFTPPGNSSQPAAPSPSEVTQTMHFTPIPRPPAGSAEPSSAPTGRSSANAPSLTPASMPFTILRQHARGGLGLVNLARDDQIKREVALKQILPQHADNGTLKKRFVYEAQITGQLEHPSIVPVYTLGNDETNNPYYVMRFVRGRTLDAIITEHHTSPNPIVFRELLRRFIAVCQAVAYAHSRGVIHRDLKPSNIMLGDYGETLVLDWGLAKDIKNKTDPAFLTDNSSTSSSSRSSQTTSAQSLNPQASAIAGASRISQLSAAGNTNELTMQGQIIGTPAYMAPEQAEGRTELHGPVTDIYALGGILYKILCGQSPQAPNASATPTATTGQRRLTFVPSQPPSKVTKSGAEIHPALEQLCLRAMATEPAARYQRALELAQDIQRWLDEHPLTLRPATPTARLHKFLSDNFVAVLSVLLVIIAILAALLIIR